ncbi:MAG: HEAT repeat domain-containing protein, partial [Acidobacteriota bacterium]
QRLLTLAQTEPNADLRGEAVRQLGVMGASDELWQMYQKDASVAARKQILQAMFIGGDAARMIELARREPDAGLRGVAVRNLGLMGGSKAGEALVDIYGTDKDPAVRKSVIEALFLRSDATALVALARKESNVDLKRDIVQKLSLIQDKVATDYMIELLNK